MRIDLISLSVVAVSALGLTGATVGKARAYVIKNPEGAYAPLALQLMIELEARRALDDGDGALKRRLLLDDLVYRPVDVLRAKRVYDSENMTRPPNWDRSFDPTKEGARKALQWLLVGQKRFEKDVNSCRMPPPKLEYFECLARSVDLYADWVERMTPTQHSVAPVAVPALREAATKIRRSDTVPQARAAVAEVVTKVRKSIDLVRAGGDDTLRRLEIGQRSVIIESMAVIDDSLVRAVGI